MKKLKVNLMMVVALVIGAVVISFGLTNKEMPKTKAETNLATTWYYTSNSTAEGAFAEADNWEQGSGSSCLPSGNKPCQISVEASDKHELAAFFSDKDNEDVLAINPTSRRN